MKLRNLLIPAFLLIMGLGTSNLMGQNSILSPNGDQIPLDSAKIQSERVLNSLLELAFHGEYYKVSKMMVYSGPDQSRDLVSKMNYYDAFDRLEVENTSNLLKHWIEKSTIHINKNFRKIPGWQHDLYVWDVEFTNKKGKTKVKKFVFTTNDKKKFFFVRADKY